VISLSSSSSSSSSSPSALALRSSSTDSTASKPPKPLIKTTSSFIQVPKKSSPSSVLDLNNKNLPFIRFSQYLPSQAYFSALKILILRNNRLSNLSSLELFQSFPNITDVDLSYNELSNKIFDMDFPRNIQRLDLSYNNFIDVTGLMSCIELRELNLANNQIKALYGLPTLLTRLDISNNQISGVPSIRSLAICSNMNTIAVSGNPVFESSIKNTRVFLKSILPKVVEIDGQLLAGKKKMLQQRGETEQVMTVRGEEKEEKERKMKNQREGNPFPRSLSQLSDKSGSSRSSLSIRPSSPSSLFSPSPKKKNEFTYVLRSPKLSAEEQKESDIKRSYSNLYKQKIQSLNESMLSNEDEIEEQRGGEMKKTKKLKAEQIENLTRRLSISKAKTTTDMNSASSSYFEASSLLQPPAPPVTREKRNSQQRRRRSSVGSSHSSALRPPPHTFGPSPSRSPSRSQSQSPNRSSRKNHSNNSSFYSFASSSVLHSHHQSRHYRHHDQQQQQGQHQQQEQEEEEELESAQEESPLALVDEWLTLATEQFDRIVFAFQIAQSFTKLQSSPSHHHQRGSSSLTHKDLSSFTNIIHEIKSHEVIDIHLQLKEYFDSLSSSSTSSDTATIVTPLPLIQKEKEEYHQLLDDLSKMFSDIEQSLLVLKQIHAIALFACDGSINFIDGMDLIMGSKVGHYVNHNILKYYNCSYTPKNTLYHDFMVQQQQQAVINAAASASTDASSLFPPPPPPPPDVLSTSGDHSAMMKTAGELAFEMPNLPYPSTMSPSSLVNRQRQNSFLSNLTASIDKALSPDSLAVIDDPLERVRNRVMNRYLPPELKLDLSIDYYELQFAENNPMKQLGSTSGSGAGSVGSKSPLRTRGSSLTSPALIRDEIIKEVMIDASKMTEEKEHEQGKSQQEEIVKENESLIVVDDMKKENSIEDKEVHEPKTYTPDQTVARENSHTVPFSVEIIPVELEVPNDTKAAVLVPHEVVEPPVQSKPASETHSHSLPPLPDQKTKLEASVESSSQKSSTSSKESAIDRIRKRMSLNKQTDSTTSLKSLDDIDNSTHSTSFKIEEKVEITQQFSSSVSISNERDEAKIETISSSPVDISFNPVSIPAVSSVENVLFSSSPTLSPSLRRSMSRDDSPNKLRLSEMYNNSAQSDVKVVNSTSEVDDAATKISYLPPSSTDSALSVEEPKLSAKDRIKLRLERNKSNSSVEN
jgi:hypothetical protein